MAETNDQPIVGGQTTAQNEAVETVLKRLEEGELFVPSYQRDSDEWDDNKKSLFIESILNRLTVPAFYLAPSEGDPDRFEVVDGQQRLTTLASFFGNNSRLEPDDDCPYFGTSVQYAGLTYKGFLSRICGVILALGVAPSCDTGQFPWRRRCESHRIVW